MKMTLHHCNNRVIFYTCSHYTPKLHPSNKTSLCSGTEAFEQVNSRGIASPSDEGNINGHCCCTPPCNSIKIRIFFSE